MYIHLACGNHSADRGPARFPGTVLLRRHGSFAADHPADENNPESTSGFGEGDTGTTCIRVWRRKAKRAAAPSTSDPVNQGSRCCAGEDGEDIEIVFNRPLFPSYPQPFVFWLIYPLCSSIRISHHPPIIQCCFPPAHIKRFHMLHYTDISPLLSLCFAFHSTYPTC